jgi:high-affinity Fe2+/Pb2+ permease
MEAIPPCLSERKQDAPSPEASRLVSPLASALLSIAILAAFLLVGGGVYLIVKRINRTQGLLMLVMAAVLVGNVLVWAV